MIGLGKRYFGQAFVNQSDIIPSLSFMAKPSLWVANINYDLSSFHNVSQIKYRVFFGPKLNTILQTVDKDLSFWIDFGFLRALANWILKFLQFGFSVTGNWGLSIILLTLFIRLLLFPLNFYSYQSMKIMKKIQPEMQAIRKKYKSDAKQMNAEILALMRQNNAKPLGGCLPMLLQFPIFFALYRVLGESFELYQAPFVLWVQDLSAKDPFYIIPVLMGAAMYVQQKMTPMNVDPAQEKILKFLPIIFTFFMINLPSGLTLYILISTLFGLIQQYYFTKSSKD